MTTQDPALWIGREEICDDNIDVGHVERIALALDQPAPAQGEALPNLWHWGLFIKAYPYEGLGRDGHPQRGGFLPPADDRNRMWAGGRLKFLQPLKVGIPARRKSTIHAVQEKEGRTGKLLFVTVRHEYTQNDVLCIDEEQDIVYRVPTAPKLSGTQAAPEGQWRETITPTSTMLFRYSAVTYNGHRIHYDESYVRDVEGYPGLVVHGPMIATYMLGAFERAHQDKKVTWYSYRGLRPLIAPKPFEVSGQLAENGEAQAWAEQDGTLAHQAELRFE